MQFRDGRRQLVGIMELSSVPPETAVTEGRYSYTPCPIHEPPVPDNIFMHLLSAAGEHSDLNGAREFRKKSERVFCTTTLKHYLWHGESDPRKPKLVPVLDYSGPVYCIEWVVSVIYAVLSKDRATAVAIGAWIVAVQTMFTGALFFTWK